MLTLVFENHPHRPLPDFREYLVDLFMTPSSQRLESPEIPGRIRSQNQARFRAIRATSYSIDVDSTIKGFFLPILQDIELEGVPDHDQVDRDLPQLFRPGSERSASPGSGPGSLLGVAGARRGRDADLPGVARPLHHLDAPLAHEDRIR